MKANAQPRVGFYPWYVVIVLTFAFTVAFIDRQILSLLVQPIRRDLGISDTQISLLAGFAFAVFYSILGVPIARLADRRSRRAIISVGVFLWSLMTAACGLAKSFAGLFVARVGVGVGEATLSPAAYSMIADYFPPQKLARAIAVYAMGLYLGAGLAMIAGSAVVRLVADAGPVTLPLLGTLFPWQLTFFAVALPGILVLAGMATVREPQRRDHLAEPSSQALSAESASAERQTEGTGASETLSDLEAARNVAATLGPSRGAGAKAGKVVPQPMPSSKVVPVAEVVDASRGSVEHLGKARIKAVPLAEVVAFFRRNLRFVIAHFAGFGLLGTVITAYMVWTPEFLRRSYGLEIADAGLIYGLILLVFGASGPYAGGWLSTWLVAKGFRDGEMRTAVIGGLAMTPLAVLTPLAPDPLTAIVLLSAATFALSFPQAFPPTLLQLMAPNRLRAQVTAIFMLVSVLTAYTIGPALVALLNDYVFRDDAALRYSLALVSAVLTPAGAACLMFGMKPFRERPDAATPRSGPSSPDRA